MTNRPTFLQQFGAWYALRTLRIFVAGVIVAAWVMLLTFIGWLFDLEQDTRNALVIAVPVFAMLAYGLFMFAWIVVYSIRVKLGRRPRRSPW